MNQFHLEDIQHNEFENLIISICQKILGIGVRSYSEGRDGGVDASFEGKAEAYPSSSSPWNGKFIIQAKHTVNPIGSCSDNEFLRTIEREIPKIKKLKDDGKIDCYLLFTNRKYTAGKGDGICEKIQQETGVINTAIFGTEIINNYLSQHKDIVKRFKLDRQRIPFDFSEQEIKELIISFKKQLPAIKTSVSMKAESLKYDFDSIQLSVKNQKNDLGQTYFEQEILSRSLIDFGKIQKFLDDPINEDIKDQYYDIAAELGAIVTLKRSNFEAFEEIFLHIYQTVLAADGEFRGKRHIYTLLHFLYCECLIGKK